MLWELITQEEHSLWNDSQHAIGVVSPHKDFRMSTWAVSLFLKGIHQWHLFWSQGNSLFSPSLLCRALFVFFFSPHYLRYVLWVRLPGHFVMVIIMWDGHSWAVIGSESVFLCRILTGRPKQLHFFPTIISTCTFSMTGEQCVYIHEHVPHILRTIYYMCMHCLFLINTVQFLFSLCSLFYSTDLFCVCVANMLTCLLNILTFVCLNYSTCLQLPLGTNKVFWI